MYATNGRLAIINECIFLVAAVRTWNEFSIKFRSIEWFNVGDHFYSIEIHSPLSIVVLEIYQLEHCETLQVKMTIVLEWNRAHTLEIYHSLHNNYGICTEKNKNTTTIKLPKRIIDLKKWTMLLMDRIIIKRAETVMAKLKLFIGWGWMVNW